MKKVHEKGIENLATGMITNVLSGIERPGLVLGYGKYITDKKKLKWLREIRLWALSPSNLWIHAASDIYDLDPELIRKKILQRVNEKINNF